MNQKHGKHFHERTRTCRAGERNEARSKKLKGQKIAVLVADGFEMAEFTVPVSAPRLAGADIKVVSLRRGRIRGVHLHEPAHKIRADLTVDEANEADFNALFVPGGFINPDLLRQSSQAREFVASFELAKKPIATLCHGPWVLASAGLASGRTLRFRSVCSRDARSLCRGKGVTGSPWREGEWWIVASTE